MLGKTWAFLVAHWKKLRFFRLSRSGISPPPFEKHTSKDLDISHTTWCRHEVLNSPVSTQSTSLPSGGYQLIECQEEQEMVKTQHTKADNEPSKDDDYYSDIRLQPLSVSMVDDYMELYTDDRVGKFCSWDAFKSRREVLKLIKIHIKQVAVSHMWTRAICLKDDKTVGIVFVTPNKGNDRCRAEIGYLLAYKYWGKGIITKAVKMAVEAVFKEWEDLERIEAFVDVENIGSQKVLQKSGFTKEGVLRKYWLLKGKPRDMVIFSLLKNDTA